MKQGGGGAEGWLGRTGVCCDGDGSFPAAGGERHGLKSRGGDVSEATNLSSNSEEGSAASGVLPVGDDDGERRARRGLIRISKFKFCLRSLSRPLRAKGCARGWVAGFILTRIRPTPRLLGRGGLSPFVGQAQLRRYAFGIF